MAGIRNKNTKPELIIRKGLHAKGFRFRLHSNKVPGKPDILLPRYRAAIFVHGCFWHRHDCHLFKMPSTRTEFWKQKLKRNVERDKEVEKLLLEAGWRRMVIWECSLKGKRRLSAEKIIELLASWLRGLARKGEISCLQNSKYHLQNSR